MEIMMIWSDHNGGKVGQEILIFSPSFKDTEVLCQILHVICQDLYILPFNLLS
jgi:hypothetical protein